MVFYRELVCRLKEEAFAVLYEDKPSRTNIAINALVSLEALKARFGWNDEEMLDSFADALEPYEAGEIDADIAHQRNRDYHP